MSEEFSYTQLRSLAITLASLYRGDSANARSNAASLLRLGHAELERRGGPGSSDAFGQRSSVEAQIGIALAIRGEHEAAVRFAERAAAHGPAQDALEGCWTQRWLALTYTIVGRRSDAVALLAAPPRRTPGCPTSAELRSTRCSTDSVPIRSSSASWRLGGSSTEKRQRGFQTDSSRGQTP